MKYITDFLGKPVISLYESNVEGYVKNVVFDKYLKKMKYLVLFEDNEFQDEKMIEISKIYNFGENAIIIKNNSALELKKEEVLEIQNHINCKVFTTLGEFIGIISNVEINEKTFIAENIILTNNKKLTPNQFLSFGQDVFILQNEDKQIKISNIKKKDILRSNKISSLNTTVSIQPQISITPGNTIALNTTIQQPNLKTTNSGATIPKRIFTNNTEFLLGRKTTKTIYSSNNEIIVKKNMNINEKVIQQAILFNKLRELAIYSA